MTAVSPTDRWVPGASAEATLQRLVDRLDVQDALTTYAAAIDVKDFAALRTVLSDDVRARYGRDEVWIDGADAVMAFIEHGVRDLDWQHHMLSVYGVDIVGDEATALVYLLSHQTVLGAPGTTRMMTSRYRNRLRREPGGWRISVLDLDVGWYEERTPDTKELAP